jgi:hypothetical protein
MLQFVKRIKKLQSRSFRIGFYKNKGELEKSTMSKKRDNGTGK